MRDSALPQARCRSRLLIGWLDRTGWAPSNPVASPVARAFCVGPGDSVPQGRSLPTASQDPRIITFALPESMRALALERIRLISSLPLFLSSPGNAHRVGVGSAGVCQSTKG